MKTICEPFLPASPTASKSVLIINTILHEKLILHPATGYFFYRTYPKLAKDSLGIKISNEAKTITDQIDYLLDSGFELAASWKKKPIDIWATNFAIGGMTTYSLLARALNEENPVVIFNKLREFYKEEAVKSFNLPFSREEGMSLGYQLDKRGGRAYSELAKNEFWDEGSSRMSREDGIGGGQCNADLIGTKLFSSYDYAYVPSHNSSILPWYGKAFYKIERELRKDASLSEAFKAFSAQESIRYLLGQKIRSMNELLGFTPLNPLGLVPSDLSDEQVADVVLKIRKECKRIRDLFEKVHVSCMKKEIDEAINAKMDLADMGANQSINYSILDNASEFMNKELQDVMHKFIDSMFEKEMKSNIIKLHKSFKMLKTKLGWISEVKFLTFGTMLILASYGADSTVIEEVFQALGSAGLGSGAVGVVSMILEEGIKLYPGFNLYASFINWPTMV